MAGLPKFLESLGSVFSGIAGAQDGVPMRVWNELKPWVSNLVPAATQRWLPRIAAGTICELPLMKGGKVTGQCDHFGVAECDVCHRPVCLEHSRIDQHAGAICYVCMVDALHAVPPLQRERARQSKASGAPPPPGPGARPPPQQPKPGPSPQQVLAALKTLGLSQRATWAQVKAAHRKLSGQNHPDKARTPRAKTVAEARFTEVQLAFTLLKQIYPEAA